MKHQQLVWSSSLFVLLALPIFSEAKIWRNSPSLAVPTTSIDYAQIVRGGSDANNVPVVPDDVLQNALNSNIRPDVARGGSTRTSSRPRYATTTTTNGGAIDVVPNQPLSSPVELAPSNFTTLVVDSKAVALPETKKSVKHHKRHKSIAKKLKVSEFDLL
jgi:hypothetical protein